MFELGVLNRDFPSIGTISTKHTPDGFRERLVTRSINGICGATRDDGAICDCPQRKDVPDRPTSLPFESSPDNNAKMKEWLLNRYAGSTFNVCPHQSLPTMSGPPVEIHLKEDAQPVACHKAASIPLHWQDQIHADLERDEGLGVIERVPLGEPVDWCHRMVVTRKPDGSHAGQSIFPH